MAGWLAVYVPWPVTFGYYLLPFAFGAAALGGAIIGCLWASSDWTQPAGRRWVARSVIAASGSLWLVALVNAAADARVQLTVDRSNADLLDFLAGLPSRSRVVLNTGLNEYVSELPMHLSGIKRRSDIVVEHGVRSAAGGSPPTDAFAVTAEMANKPWPTVRVALDESGVRRDTARLGTALSVDAVPVYRASRRTRVVELGIHRLLCVVAVRPVADTGFCPGDRGVMDDRVFSYGWQVHRLTAPARADHPRPGDPQRQGLAHGGDSDRHGEPPARGADHVEVRHDR